MKRNALLVVALVVAVAFTVLAKVSGGRHDQGSQAAGPATTSTAPAAPGQGGGPTATQVASPGGVDPDSFFTPTKLKPGEKPPQFVIVSFDGAGSHEKWTYWRGVADKAGMRFTGFLSGIYLVDEDHRTAYHGPGHKPGKSSINFFSHDEVKQVVEDLNAAWAKGYEIGTHYNGHFCSGSEPAANDWTTAQWTDEIDQFFTFYKKYKEIDHDASMPTLQVPIETIKGGRTPCLEGRPEQLMPALKAAGFAYDSSSNRNGVAWPSKNSFGIWEFPMAYVPMPGKQGGVISMDYNFWVKQTGNPPSTGNSTADSAQVLQTYQQMFHAAYNGNRAPLVLGNHFNSWNNNAYTQALSGFVQQACHQPDTYCVPYRDVIRWMQAQDPRVLNSLQRQPAVDTVA